MNKRKKCDKFQSIYLWSKCIFFQWKVFFVFGIRKVLNLLDYFVKICPFWHNILANSKYQSFSERSKWTVINFVTKDLYITLFKKYERIIDWTMISREKENRYCLQFWHCHSSWIILDTFVTLWICWCWNHRLHWGGNQTFITRWYIYFGSIVAKEWDR